MKHRVVLWSAVLVLTSSSLTARAALTHHWDFEEPDGTSTPQVHDIVGGDHGTFSANMDDTNRSSDVPAAINSTRSLDFDPSSLDAITLGTSITLGKTTDFTVTLWYKGADSGDNHYPGATDFNYGSTLAGWASNSVYANFTIVDGKLAYIHYNGGWQILSNIAGTDVSDDAWHHLALVHHADQTADLYVDGQLEITGDATSGFDYEIHTFMEGYNVHYTQGLLDDARIYDTALTAAEVSSLVPEPASLALAAGGLLLLRRTRTRR
jgi:hypothetical protein